MSHTDTLSALERQVELRMTVDLKFLAHEIELRFNDLLEPPPAGIYSHLHVDPVMVNGQQYYTRHKVENLSIDFLNDQRTKLGLIESGQWGGHVLIRIDDINTVKRGVYTRDGKCVIPTTTMKEREKHLSNQPLLPYRGSKIAHLLYRMRIEEAARYPHSRIDYISRIQEHVLEGAYTNDELEMHLHEFYMEVGEYTTDFMYHHEWKVVRTKLEGTVLHLERGVDFRILDWTRQREEQDEARQEWGGSDRRRHA